MIVAADDYKTELPEYDALTDNGENRAAGYVHEESTAISREVMKQSLDMSSNTVLDATGNASEAGLESKIQQARDAGCSVRGEYVTCSVETALARALERERKTGRNMPEAALRSTHRLVSQILPRAIEKGLFDSVNLWDNDSGTQVLIASAKGSELTVHDSALWDSFLAKGAEE